MAPHDGRSSDDRWDATDDVPSVERENAFFRARRRGVVRSEVKTSRGFATTDEPRAFPALIPVGCSRVVQADE